MTISISNTAWANTARRGGARAAIGATILAFHYIILLHVAGTPTHVMDDLRKEPEPTSATAWLINRDNEDLDTVPLPEVELETLRVNVAALEEIRFDDSEQGDISGVTARASAPRLTEYRPDVESFARLAGLAPGQVATVVVVIEVLTNGSVGTVGIARSSGNLTVDAAALNYARSLHWIPGTTDQHAQVMRINFPVVLHRSA